MASTVADLMTTDVTTIPETARYTDIVAVLRRRGVSALPVLDTGRRVVGIVSEADLLDTLTGRRPSPGAIRLAWQLTQWSKASTATAADLMTAPAVTIGRDATVAEGRPADAGPPSQTAAGRRPARPARGDGQPR